MVSYHRLLFLFLFFLTNTLFSQEKKLPSPESVLGFKVGADFKLATYEEAVDYFQQLDALSDFMEMRDAGFTSEGRMIKYAVISSPENLKNLDRYREISQQLAHPKNVTKEAARKLAKEGKPIVHIDGGLHASEVAAPQHTLQLIYDILSQTEKDEIKLILDNVILLLWPTINPDGQDMIVEWYKSNLGTPYEVAPMPKLYQKYVGHDNNRDAYALNMIESRVMGRVWREWEPQIIHVHHQSSPFPTRIWLPPFAEPIATQAPPIISREINMIGMAMAQALETNGQVGAVHMGTGFDAWYPGYIDYLPVFQNIAAYWTETALYRYATPYFYTMNDFPNSRKDLRSESLYNSPWKGGWWRLRDAVEYMETASLAVLDYAAKYKETLLYNRYQSGIQSINKYQEEPPFAYFIPPSEKDPSRPVELLRRLAFNDIRVSQIANKISFDGKTYPKGTWVIPMDQEYAALARQLLKVQAYPDLREYPEGPPEQPYDAAGWTLPLIFDCEVIPIMKPLPENIRKLIKPVKGEMIDWKKGDQGDFFPDDAAPGVGFHTNPIAAGIIPQKGTLKGYGNQFVIKPSQNNGFRALNRAKEKGGEISFDQTNGEYVISGISNSVVKKMAEDFAIKIQATKGKIGTSVNNRIGLYRPSTASMDEGWTRWVLEQYEFVFTNIKTQDISNGNLNDNYDVIVLPSDRAGRLENGFKKGSVPPQYEGGLGVSEQNHLDEFVRNGGTLICLNQSSELIIKVLGLPVKNEVAGISRRNFFTGGSVMEVETNQSHQVTAGLDAQVNVFVWRSPVFKPLEGFKGEVLASYKEYGSPLRSGYLLGERYLHGNAAALDVHHGKGHVILLGFRPQWRGQTFGTFRILFNSVLYSPEKK